MKKWLVALIFTSLYCGNLYAAVNQREYKTWRSSETCSAEALALVSTGSIYLYSVTVTSGNSTDAQFVYVNSTGTATQVFRSTSTNFDINNTGDIFYVEDILSRGFEYSKTGTTCIKIKWDWLISPNPGQESRGLK